MNLLVNVMGLLNVGGLVIICILTFFTSSKKFAGEYKNKWYTTLMGIIILDVYKRQADTESSDLL